MSRLGQIKQTFKSVRIEIKAFLRRQQWKEALIFFCFILLAFGFWLLQSLQQEYEIDIRIPVKYKNVPPDISFTETPPEAITVKVKDKGSVLLNYSFGRSFAPIEANMKTQSEKSGNFNEKTARIYSDMALLTSNAELITDINKVFAVLEGKLAGPTFRHLLVARFNMVPELTRMIHREIEHVKAGRKGRIVLKMNGLHDQNMINELYNASENGVEIDLIVRGICCLVPNRPFSANIKVTRIVDMFLEHSRIWYFYNDGEEELFLTSADWMRRNLNRRIETAFPILNAEIKRNIIDILNIQLQDNVKACLIDEHLHNNFKRDGNPVKVRAQLAVYEYLKNKI